MSEQTPYVAPQITEHVIKTTVPPVNRRHRQHAWEEPLRTQLADIARHQRAMLRYAALHVAEFIGIGAWFVWQQRDLDDAGWRWLTMGLLLPVSILLVVSVYQLVARMDDGGDSPLFVALAALVPGFNLLLVFHFNNTAREYLRESGIASGWTGITPEQFAAQVALARETAQAPNPPGALPVAEAIERPASGNTLPRT